MRKKWKAILNLIFAKRFFVVTGNLGCDFEATIDAKGYVIKDFEKIANSIYEAVEMDEDNKLQDAAILEASKILSSK